MSKININLEMDKVGLVVNILSLLLFLFLCVCTSVICVETFSQSPSETTTQETTQDTHAIITEALNHISYWEVTSDGLDLYDEEGNLYEWR